SWGRSAPPSGSATRGGGFGPEPGGEYHRGPMYRPHFDPSELGDAPRAQLRKVLALFRPHVGLVSAAMLCVLAGAGLGLIPQPVVKSVIDDALPHHDSGRLDLLVVLMVAAPLLAGLISVLQTYL